MKRYTWGIMGLGKIAATFAAALSSLDNTAIVCASRSEKKAKEFAERFSALRYYGSYEQMCHDSEIDIIYVATPMSCHYEDVKLCLTNGKNVLCEKSAAINAAQWRELCNMAAERGLFLMEAMWMKFLPAFRKALEWVKAGRIGKVYEIRAAFCVKNEYDGKDRLFLKELGGGSLLDLGVYPLTFACEFLGYSPTEIKSEMSFGVSRVDFDERIELIYNDGVNAQIRSSFDFTLSNSALILGGSGFIRFDPWFFCSRGVTLISGDTREDFREEFPCNGYEFEIMEAHCCLERGALQSKINPHSDTEAVLKIMDEVRKAHGFIYDGEPFEE